MTETTDFFQNYLPNKLTEHPGLAGEINAVYLFDIDGAGQWTVDLTEGSGAVIEGATKQAGCVVSASLANFEKLMTSPASAAMMFMTGQLKVTNVSLAMALQKLLS